MDERFLLKKKKKSLEVEIDQNIAMDVEQLSIGGYKPLRTFMNLIELDSVLKKMRLPNGMVWPIPVLFPKPKNEDIVKGMSLLLKHRGSNFTILRVTDVFTYNKTKLIKSFFGTTSKNHPGVVRLQRSPNTFITGQLKRLKPLSKIIKISAMEPSQVKKIIKKKSWKRVVGFHTRNIPHRAHEFLQKSSLENSDGLLIHPVVGSKKKGDFSNKAIMESYRVFLQNYLPKENVILTPLLIYSRYAGPKEALFTAIVRRNYGCTHFIVGRDHTGVKNFYGKYDSQKIFSNFTDLGVTALCFNEPYYCKKCDQITTNKTCPHTRKYHIEISGTKIRKSVLNKSKISDKYVRMEIINKLQNMKDVLVK